MNKPSATIAPSTIPPDIAKLLDQYGCGPVHFAGTHDALYERHLIFDAVVDVKDSGLGNALKRSPARCGTFSRNAGC